MGSYFRTFDGDTVESYKEPDAYDCPECGSDNTTYLNYTDGNEIRRCYDCNNYFEIINE